MSSYEGKVSVDKKYPVVLINSAEAPVLTRATGNIVVKYWKEGATSLSTYSPIAGEWQEAGEGGYSLTIGASEFTSAGKWMFTITPVTAGQFKIFRAVVEVRSFTFEDLFTGANVGTIKLKSLSIANGAGDAVTISGTAGRGLYITSTSTFPVSIQSQGLNVAALDVDCANGGNAINARVSAGTGSGIVATGLGANSHGISALGAGGGHGVNAQGGLTGDGVRLNGGGTSGHGLYAIAATSGYGIWANGSGAGAGMRMSGGAKDLDCTLDLADTSGALAVGAFANHPTVDIGKVAGSAVAGVNDFKANVTALGTLANQTTILSNQTTVNANVLANGVAIAALPSAGTVADSVWDEPISGHVGAGSFGSKNQIGVPSAVLNDYKADVSGLATLSAQSTMQGNITSILEDTGVTIPATLSGLATLSAQSTMQGNVTSILTDTDVTIPALISGVDVKIDTLDGKADDILEDTGVTIPATLATLGTSANQTTINANVLANGVAIAALPSAGAVADSVWDEPKASHISVGSFGLMNQTAVPSSNLADYKADVSGLATLAAQSSMQANITDILTDTDVTIPAMFSGLATLSNQTTINNNVLANGTAIGIVDTNVDLILADTTNILADGVKLNGVGLTGVNSQVSDVLFTDTIPELPVSQPPTNPTFAQATMLKYMIERNEHEQTAGLFTVKNNAGVIVAKADVLVVAGVSVKSSKMVAGDA